MKWRLWGKNSGHWPPGVFQNSQVILLWDMEIKATERQWWSFEGM